MKQQKKTRGAIGISASNNGAGRGVFDGFLISSASRLKHQPFCLGKTVSMGRYNALKAFLGMPDRGAAVRTRRNIAQHFLPTKRFLPKSQFFANSFIFSHSQVQKERDFSFEVQLSTSRHTGKQRAVVLKSNS